MRAVSMTLLRRVAMAALLSAGAIAPARSAPPAGGSISIESTTASAPGPAFVAAASEALAAHGFTILEQPGHAAYVAELSLARATVGTGSARIPAGAGAIAPGVAGGAGAGVAIPLPSGGPAIVPLERTTLELRIRKRGEAAVIWHGAAVTVRPAGTREGADPVVASLLSDALLRNYPAEPRDIVGVP